MSQQQKMSKFSDCNSCPLKCQPRCIGETNAKSIEDIDLFVIAEAPSHEEIKQNRPLIGRAGQIFRQVFNNLGLDKYKYFITNVVLCANIVDGKTVTPPTEAVEKCRGNWQALIKKMKPKVILVLGSTAMNAFALPDFGFNPSITRLRGNFYEYEGIPLMLTFHPSYILRQVNLLDSEEGLLFKKDIASVKKYLDSLILISPTSTNNVASDNNDDKQTQLFDFEDKNDNKVKRNNRNSEKEKLTQCYSFEIPDWCYDEKLMLLDCQEIYSDKSILYIFKDSNNSKKYYKTPSFEYYYYTCSKYKDIQNSNFIVPISDVELVKTNFSVYDYNNSYLSSYESDVRPEIKRIIDYRYNRKTEEPTYKLSKLFVDIEVFSNGDLEFPDPKKAEKPICSITFKLDDNITEIWVANLGNKLDIAKLEKYKETLTDAKLVIFNSEKDLLFNFAKKIAELNPDILTGWNFVYFDMLTIFGRMLKNSIDLNIMSPVNNVYFEPRYSKMFVYGICVLDMLDLYKNFTQGSEESYSLDFISKKYLGEGKVEHIETLDELYLNDVCKFIDYAKTDVELLRQLDIKLGFIDLRFNLVRICNTSWKAAESSMNLIDSLCLSYAKKNNLVCRNSLVNTNNNDSESSYIPGGYVRTPKSGRFSYVVDFDFSSLYPSIIRSCNIGPNTYIAKIDIKDALDIIYKRDELDMDKKIEVIMNPMYKDRVIAKRISIRDFIKKVEEKGYILTTNGTIFKSPKEDVSFFSKILELLMSERSKYRKLKKEASDKNDLDGVKIYDSIQIAYKILANTLYGVLANNAFRFFNLDLASTITITGQDIIKFIGYHINKVLDTGAVDFDKDFFINYDGKNLEYVLYQDTDSIFLDIGKKVLK